MPLKGQGSIYFEGFGKVIMSLLVNSKMICLTKVKLKQLITKNDEGVEVEKILK